MSGPWSRRKRSWKPCMRGLWEEAGADSAAVFMGHRMLLKDEEYRNSVTRAITGERVNAAFAVETVGDELCRLFLEMEDEYLRARAADIRDVSDRLLRILEEEEKGGGRCGRGPALSEPVILAARDLAPSETVLLDKKKILGFVTEQALPIPTQPFWQGPWRSRPWCRFLWPGNGTED